MLFHSSELTHNTNERLNWIDNTLYDFLSRGYRENLFQNTAIFLYSDHGARFVDKRAPHNRYLEERLPFMAIYLPKQFDKVKNFNQNLNLLTSPFDIYSTIKELACLDRNKPLNEKFPLRSISLLNKIPKHRECEHIGISDHYCTCIRDWKSSSINNEEIVNAAKFAIDSINQITSPARHKCQELDLKTIISAETLNVKNNAQLIRVQFIARQNMGIYESILVNKLISDYEFKSDKFSIKSRHDISRIDAYDKQPFCVLDLNENPIGLLDIRKFCSCK